MNNVKGVILNGRELQFPSGSGTALGEPVQDARVEGSVELHRDACMGAVSGKTISLLTDGPCELVYELSDGTAAELGVAEGSFTLPSEWSAAPAKAECIGVYHQERRVGYIPLGSLSPPEGECLYSFGMLADPHVGVGDANFERAMEYFSTNPAVRFVCIAGDIVDKSGEYPERWDTFDEILDRCGFTIPGKQGNGKRVYAVSGNHEQWHFHGETVREHTGLQLWREVSYGDDVFILLGCKACYTAGDPDFQFVSLEDQQKVMAMLERNRNKRCFVIQHVEPVKLTNSFSRRHIPIEVWRHYKNAMVFFGHAHNSFEGRGVSYKESNGFRSTYVPACGEYAQGYIVDVYEDAVHLRGMSFGEDGTSPVAKGTYKVDTTTVAVEAGSCPDVPWIAVPG